MFDSHDLAPQRHATESQKAYRARRIEVGQKVEEYLRSGRSLFDSYRFGNYSVKKHGTWSELLGR